MGYAGQQGPGQGLQQGNAAPAHFTKLYVTNIPPELLRIAPLTQHFEQFGEVWCCGLSFPRANLHASCPQVVTIRLSSPREDGGTGRAIVQFRRHEDAKRALEVGRLHLASCIACAAQAVLLAVARCGVRQPLH